MKPHRNTAIWIRAHANLERESINLKPLPLALLLGLPPATAVPMERPLERREMTDEQVEADIDRKLSEQDAWAREHGHLPLAKLPPYASGRMRGTIPPPAPPK